MDANSKASMSEGERSRITTSTRVKTQSSHKSSKTALSRFFNHRRGKEGENSTKSSKYRAAKLKSAKPGT